MVDGSTCAMVKPRNTPAVENKTEIKIIKGLGNAIKLSYQNYKHKE